MRISGGNSKHLYLHVTFNKGCELGSTGKTPKPDKRIPLDSDEQVMDPATVTHCELEHVLEEAQKSGTLLLRGRNKWADNGSGDHFEKIPVSMDDIEVEIVEIPVKDDSPAKVAAQKATANSPAFSV